MESMALASPKEVSGGGGGGGASGTIKHSPWLRNCMELLQLARKNLEPIDYCKIYS
jgi:hypothetical protein